MLDSFPGRISQQDVEAGCPILALEDFGKLLLPVEEPMTLTQGGDLPIAPAHDCRCPAVRILFLRAINPADQAIAATNVCRELRVRNSSAASFPEGQLAQLDRQRIAIHPVETVLDDQRQRSAARQP